MKFRELSVSGELTFYTSVLTSAVMALYVPWVPPVMILWGLLWIYQTFTGEKTLLKGSRPFILFILFISLLLWQTGEIALANSVNDGIERVFKRLSMFLFPLVMFLPGAKIKENISLILRVFAIFVFIYLIYCFGNAFSNSLTLKDGRWIFNSHHPLYTWESFFMGARLSDPVHPTYLTMYIMVSILVALESLADKTVSAIARYLWGAAVLIFAVSVFLLSSRAGVIASFIVFPLYFIIRFYRRLSKYLVIMIFVVAAAGALYMLKNNERIKYSIDDLSEKGVAGTFTHDARYYIWNAAIGVIREHPFAGVGTGNATTELKKEFLGRGYTNGYYDNLNAHNQFLEIMLENGIPGILIFISILGYMAYIAVRERNLLLLLFLIMMTVFFMFESLLNRLAGVAFFPFITFLFLYMKTE
jgi:O-antigen ligase